MKEIPLVLIHGYPFNHSMWFSTIASLGSHASVLAPDLPGFGRGSVPLEETPSLESYARSVANAMSDHQHEKAVIAGMSMGGYVALAFAEMYPERVCGLGLISSQAAADPPEVKKARSETISNIRANGVAAATDAVLPKMFSESKASERLRHIPIESAQIAGIDGLCWALEAMARRPDRTELIEHLEHPVLILHGVEDKIVPVAKTRALADACLKPVYVEIEGVGHASPLEAPDQVAGALARFMKVCRAELGG